MLTLVLAGAGAGTASAAQRAYVGFLDDESLRWAPDRQTAWNELGAAHATVARTIVDWSEIAPRQPRNAADPFDPAYRWNDLDDFIRSAQRRGIEVLLTLWGTPRWANGGARPNVPPRNPRAFGRFAHAVAARYSGRHAGLPFARFFSIWNEPNTPRFLHAADPVGAYAELAAAGVAGVRAGSRGASVAIGETAASHAPARFMEALAARDPKLDFDAWAHHPYPAVPGLGPDVPESWPDVGVRELARFGDDVDRAFGRTGTPLWATEYGESLTAVSRTRQAADLARAVALAVAVPRVQMFVWLMLRNHRGEPWQSGVLGSPALTAFRSAADGLDPRNAVVALPRAAGAVVVGVPALELRWGVAAGQYVDVTYFVSRRGVRVSSATESAAMGRDGWVPVSVRLPGDEPSYTVRVAVRDARGSTVQRTVSMVTPAPAAMLHGGAAASPRRPR